jgi:hypothetical protein
MKTVLLNLVLLIVCSIQSSAQAFVQKDSLKVKVLRVIDADTYMVQYRKDVFTVRVRNENPKDTLDTWDKGLRQAHKQSARYGIAVDSIRTLGERATLFMDSVLSGKRVVLRRYADQFTMAQQWSYNRLLRGVEFEGRHVREILPVIFLAK